MGTVVPIFTHPLDPHYGGRSPENDYKISGAQKI